MGLFSKKTMLDKSLQEINNNIFNLFILDRYISRKDVYSLFEKNVIEEFVTYDNKNMLESYCKNNKQPYEDYLKMIKQYKNLISYIDDHNEKFVNTHLKSDKDYFDHILDDVDSSVKLDEEQRKVALNDDDYSLIIAGAGAGKTTTLAAKVKYMVDKLHVKPEEILIIAFTNKAVNELKDKIQKKLNINAAISTFHSCGRAIVKKDEELAETSILNDNFFFIHNYVCNEIKKDKTLLQKLIMLFAFYIDIDDETLSNISLDDHFSLIEKADYSTLKSNINQINQQFINLQTKKQLTIQNEFLRSFEEVRIANFLFLNSIDYEYEKAYPFMMPNARKLYTPDFFIKQGDKCCYIEHFGISEDGHNTRYNQQELNDYIFNMNCKIMFHKQHNTKLISTYSHYNDGRTLLEHLEEELLKAGFILNKKSDAEIYEKILENKNNKYVFRFSKIVTNFINLFKAKDYSEKEFAVFKSKTKNPRTLLFLEIIEKIYLAYQLHLKENKLVDFQDLINESTRLLKEVQNVREKISFKYILIDEFQDISRSRLNLVQEIEKATGAKIAVVGDDWQAIYGYAGSEINLFTHFKEQMGYASELKITHTYRNSQQLIDIAGDFVQVNNKQLKKSLISPKNIEKPISIYTYDGSNKNASKDFKGVNFCKAELLTKILKLLIKLNGEDQKILLIGRYNFECKHLIETGLFHTIGGENTFKLRSNIFPKLNLTFMTAHTTKGLTYDNVVILNAVNSRYGFPAQIDDDPVLNFVRTKDESYDFAEERRLFYVALTRTKNRVFILAPDNNPSTFAIELLDRYGKEINLQDKEFNLNKNITVYSLNKQSCPCCGYPLISQSNKNYGLKLYICTNEPERCDYMTNNLVSGRESIRMCNKCGSGVMYVKKTTSEKNQYIFGCSNYKKDGTGCNNIEYIDGDKNG